MGNKYLCCVRSSATRTILFGDHDFEREGVLLSHATKIVSKRKEKYVCGVVIDYGIHDCIFDFWIALFDAIMAIEFISLHNPEFALFIVILYAYDLFNAVLCAIL